MNEQEKLECGLIGCLCLTCVPVIAGLTLVLLLGFLVQL